MRTRSVIAWAGIQTHTIMIKREQNTVNELAGESSVCFSCIAPNEPKAEFCVSCSAPLGATAALDPVSSIRAEGFVLQRAFSKKRPKFILVFGIWVLFVPWLIGGGAVSVSHLITRDGMASFFFFWAGIALVLVAVKVLYSVTRNYLTLPDASVSD